MSSNAGVVVTYVLLAFASILVGARLYTKGLGNRTFWPEDPLMLVSLLGALAHQVGIAFQIHQGLGDVPKVDADEGDTGLEKWLFATIVTYQVTHTFLSLSITYQYQKMLTLQSAKTFSLFLAIWLGTSGALGVGLVPFHCTPVQDFWIHHNGLIIGCQNYSVVSLALVILNLANDLVLWASLLASSFWLKISRGRKIALCGVLILGFAAVVCSALRLSAAGHIPSPSAISLQFSQALFFSITGSLEISLGIIAACLVTIQPLWPRAVELLHRRSTPIGARALNSSLSGYGHQAQGSRSGQSILLDELTPAGRAQSQPGNDPVPSSREESPITSLPLTDSEVPQPYTPCTLNNSRPVPGPSFLQLAPNESSGPSDAPFVDVPLDTPPERPATPRPATPVENFLPGIVVTTTLDIFYCNRAELGQDWNDDGLSFGTTTTCAAQGPASRQGQRNSIHHFNISHRR